MLVLSVPNGPPSERAELACANMSPLAAQVLDDGTGVIQSQLGYLCVGLSNVLMVLPVGHTPGIYLVSAPVTVRTVAAAGSIGGTLLWSSPGFGASTLQTGTVIINLGTGPGAITVRSIISDGTAPVTVQFSPVGVAGLPVVDLYAGALLEARF